MITNAYVIYLHVNLENRIIKKDVLSHNDFRKAVALSWINQIEQDEELPAPVSTRKRKVFSGSSLSSISGCSNTYGVAKKRVSLISDVSLGPRGTMSIRMETQYDHLPQRLKI